MNESLFHIQILFSFLFDFKFVVTIKFASFGHFVAQFVMLLENFHTICFVEVMELGLCFSQLKSN